jgi:hypothetical protein
MAAIKKVCSPKAARVQGFLFALDSAPATREGRSRKAELRVFVLGSAVTAGLSTISLDGHLG